MTAVVMLELVAILWTVLWTITLGAAIYSAVDAHRDLQALDLKRLTNGKRIISRAGRKFGLVRAAGYLLFVLLGVAGLVATLIEPDPPSGPGEFLSLFLFEAAALLFCWNEVGVMRVRRKLLRQIPPAPVGE